MSVWMIAYRKAVCLGVFHLIVTYLAKSITQVALELVAQQQRDFDISVTQQLEAASSRKHLQTEGPSESLSPHKLLLVSWSKNYENYVRTMDAS